MVTGNGFDLIQRATMKVRPSTDEFSDDTSPDLARVGPEVCREDTVTQGWETPTLPVLYPTSLLFPLQFVEEARSKNDTVLQFDSPAVNCSCNIQALQTFLHLDNVVEELNSFDYHPDPSFNELLKNVITETSIIIVTVRTRTRAHSPVKPLQPPDPPVLFRVEVSTRP